MGSPHPKQLWLPGGPVAILQGDAPFPPVTQALRSPNGLLAIGGDLSTTRLLQAYRQGIFPWYSAGEPVLWWNPDPRMALFPDQLVIARALRKVIAQQRFTLRMNSAFAEVIHACARTPRPGQDGTWLQPEVIDAYIALHMQGYAHSVEAWQDGRLVGGCYGVRIGRMFYGESMFHQVSNASKVAFVHLVQWCLSQQIGMIDCQMYTPLLASFGARELPRAQFLEHLNRLTHHDTAQ